MTGFILGVFKAFALMLIFISLLFIAYVVTKLVGVKVSRTMKGKYISLVETVSLGMDKRLHLIKVGDQFILIASSGKNIIFLTKVKLDDEEIVQNETAAVSFDFRHILDKYMQNFKGLKRKNVPTEEIKTDIGSSENDSIFSRNLNKLKFINNRMESIGKWYEDHKPEKK